MKYIVLIAVITTILFSKPWEITFTEEALRQTDTTLLLTASGAELENTRLLPASEAFCNSFSELPETQKDRIIKRFMKNGKSGVQSFALIERQLNY